MQPLYLGRVIIRHEASRQWCNGFTHQGIRGVGCKGFQGRFVGVNFFCSWLGTWMFSKGCSRFLWINSSRVMQTIVYTGNEKVYFCKGGIFFVKVFFYEQTHCFKNVQLPTLESLRLALINPGVGLWGKPFKKG